MGDLNFTVTGSAASSSQEANFVGSFEMVARGTWNGGSITLQRNVGVGSNVWVDVKDSFGNTATMSADGVMGKFNMGASMLRINPSGVTSVIVDLVTLPKA